MKSETKIYLIIIIICFLAAAGISFFKTKAPEMADKIIAKQIERRASEMGVEGVDGQEVKKLLEKHTVKELIDKYNNK